jgi:hypothetical protein
MNRFTTSKNSAPQQDYNQQMKTYYQEFEENKKYMERFVADCVICVMEG